MRIKTYFRWAIWAIAAIVVWLAGILLLYGILYLDWVSIFGIRCDRQRRIPRFKVLLSTVLAKQETRGLRNEPNF